VAVERLTVGDIVPAQFAGSARIVWLGHRRVDSRHDARPRDVWPVRVCAGAFGPAAPARDLLLSPDHAIFADGALIPIRHLVNHATVVQERCDEVTYWHVELDQHDVILAEGLPCESFLDSGNRAAFADGGRVVHLHADLAARIWYADGCATLLVAGPIVERARARLAGAGAQIAPWRGGRMSFR